MNQDNDQTNKQANKRTHLLGADFIFITRHIDGSHGFGINQQIGCCRLRHRRLLRLQIDGTEADACGCV
jgi:hypothetical protein